MGHVYFKIWIHLIWSTKNRFPFLSEKIRNSVLNHILENAQKKGYYIDKINGYSEHIHLLASLNPKHSISEVVNYLKGEVSHWINFEKLTRTHFAWQQGYSAFSVSESQVDKVRKYIENQEEHHKKSSFMDELINLYKFHKIEFDEKYLS